MSDGTNGAGAHRRAGLDRRRAVAALGATCLAAGAGPASADATVLPRLREIRARLLDPGQVFSISRTLAELDAIETKIGDAARDAAERGELSYLRGFVLFKAKRAAQSIPPSLEAIRIDEAAPFLPAPLRLKLVYNVAVQAEELKRWPLAIDHFRKALALFPTDPGASEDQRLGTLERLGFCLQEAGRSAEAKVANEEVLAGGERLHGRDSDKLLTVLNNLAQNVYDLGDKGAARPLLERRLAIALGHDEDAKVEDTLFQLGVLAFETGRPEEAEALMKRRLRVAEASRDRSRIDAARRDLDELYERMKR